MADTHTQPRCTVCGRRKKPIGRDSMDDGLCSQDCHGYRNEPIPNDKWFGEEAWANNEGEADNER